MLENRKIPDEGTTCMPDFKTILYSLEDGIATITLNRPEQMNAFNPQMTKDLLAVFDITDSDDEVKAVIVTGAGDRAFCAGADLGAGGDTFDYSAYDDADSLPKSGNVYRDLGGLVTLRIFDSLKPVIAASNGAAAGVGSIHAARNGHPDCFDKRAVTDLCSRAAVLLLMRPRPGFFRALSAFPPPCHGPIAAGYLVPRKRCKKVWLSLCMSRKTCCRQRSGNCSGNCR